MSNDFQNEFDKQVVVSLITSKKEELVQVDPFEVLIDSTLQNGLERKSKILLNRLQTIDKELRLIKRLGQVDEKTWEKV
jgi:mRNA-degrading endonuclease toxin of MazEF toxin-antitoxin module